MEYRDFSGKDFAGNGFFIRWVKNPDAETNWFWESFIKEHPEKAVEIEEGRQIVLFFKFKEEELSEKAISDMRNRILMSVRADLEIAKDNPLTSLKKSHSKSRILWMRWAAVFSLPLIALAYLIVVTTKSATTNSLSTLQDKNSVNVEKRANPKGQKSMLLLADGTKVWLNADSRLNYSKDFGVGSTREVYLEGEAFFEVARNPAKPFLVHTSAISIKVLGTAFNVKSYPIDKTIETTLVHGKVSINKKGRTDQEDRALILKPNQRAIYIKKSNTVNVEQVMAERATAWRHDKLIFDETPFADAIAQLERWYDVKIILDQQGELKCALTAEIENEKLEDVLKLLEESHQVTSTISGKEVFIKGTLCK
jgi:transmembrane sensor